MLKQLLVLLGLTLSLSVNSAIIDLGNITRDTSTGLDWLDVTETRELSYNQVSAQLGVGGDYEGYRYATVAELDQLIVNFGYTAVNTNCSYTALHCDDPAYFYIITDIITLLGDTYDAAGDAMNSYWDVPAAGLGGVTGILGTQHRNVGSYDVAEISWGALTPRDNPINNPSPFNPTPLFPQVETVADFSFSPEESNVWVGSFLVTTIPVPAASWLFMSALIGLVGIKRKK